MTDIPLLNWQPPQKVVLFPSVRRRAMIERLARSAAAAKDPTKTIRATMDRLRASHARKDVHRSAAERDLRQLEDAIWARVAALRAQQGRTA